SASVSIPIRWKGPRLISKRRSTRRSTPTPNSPPSYANSRSANSNSEALGSGSRLQRGAHPRGGRAPRLRLPDTQRNNSGRRRLRGPKPYHSHSITGRKRPRQRSAESDQSFFSAG